MNFILKALLAFSVILSSDLSTLTGGSLINKNVGFSSTQGQPYTITAPNSSFSATTTNFFGSIVPQASNSFDLGSTSSNWRTLFANTVSTTNFYSLNATTTNVTTTNQTVLNLSAGIVTSSLLALTPMTNGSILFTTSSGQVSQNNANLFWDNVNNRLGLGTTTPNAQLAVKATAGTAMLNITSSTDASALYIDTSGKIGVANTSPGAALDVGTGYNTTAYTIKTGSLLFQPYALNNEFVAENTYFNSGWKYLNAGYGSGFQFNSGQVELFGMVSGAAGAAAAQILPLKTDSLGNVALGGNISPTANDFTGARMVVQSGGQVGINSTTPNAQLAIKAAAGNTILNITSSTDSSVLQIDTGSNIFMNPNGVGDVGIGNGGTESLGIISAGAAFDSQFKINDVGGQHPAELIMHEHSLTQPAREVFARSNSDTSAHAPLTNGQSIGAVFFLGTSGFATSSYSQFANITGGADTNGTISTSSAPGFLSFATSPSGTISSVEAMRIVNNGNVGVNTSSPGYKLSVSGTVQFWNLTTSAGLQTAVLCQAADGQVIADSATCLASSRKVKQDIKPLEIGIDELMKLKPVSFKYKPSFLGSRKNNPNFNGTQYSLIAEDVQAVDKNLVSIDTSGPNKGQANGLQTLNNWVGLFVKSIQDLERQVVALMFRQNTTDAKIQRLEKMVDDQQDEIRVLQKKVMILQRQ